MRGAQDNLRRFQIDGSPILLDPDIAVFRLKPDGSPWPAGISLTSAVDRATGQIRFAVGEEVFLLHYPGERGFSFDIKGMKKIVTADDEVLAYNLSTEPGSSGAPVINPNWELLAVHWGYRGNNRNIGFRIDAIVSVLRRQLPNYPGGDNILKGLGLR